MDYKLNRNWKNTPTGFDWTQNASCYLLWSEWFVKLNSWKVSYWFTQGFYLEYWYSKTLKQSNMGNRTHFWANALKSILFCNFLRKFEWWTLLDSWRITSFWLLTKCIAEFLSRFHFGSTFVLETETSAVWEMQPKLFTTLLCTGWNGSMAVKLRQTFLPSADRRDEGGLRYPSPTQQEKNRNLTPNCQCEDGMVHSRDA